MVGYIFIVAFFMSLLTLSVTVQEKKTPFNVILIIGCILSSLWLFLDALPYTMHFPWFTVLLFKGELIITIFLIPLLYSFILVYTGYVEHWRWHLLTMVVPAICLISLVTGLPFSFISALTVTYEGYIPTTTFTAEIGYYIYLVYSYVLMILVMGFLIFRAFRGPIAYRVETLQITAFMFFCLGGNAMSLWMSTDAIMWENDAVDMTSVFVYAFFVAIYTLSLRPQMNFDDRNMQIMMNKGLRDNEYHLVLQPQYEWSGKAYEIVGAEALIRWVRNGEIYRRPDQFIPIAESNRMIIPIGNWIVDEILRINTDLYHKGIGIKLAINVSAVQLQSENFTKHLTEALAAYHVPLDLVIEVTESSMMEHEERVVEHLNAIKKMGLKIALDDFGTGYSALSYLKVIPLDYLKIDKSFIDDVHRDPESLTPYILDIAKNLGLKTIVEGTEHLEQVDFLKDKCDLFQGYYFSKPVQVSELINTMTSISG